ncbi:MAG: DUF3365 domain-containing protein [Planctomycetes bacterium]|nr:DUF3365 domain-containing protein [Planctomycetota bacterium]
MRSGLDRLWRFVVERPVLTLALLACTAAGLLLWHMSALSRGLVEYKALQDAGMYADAISTFRTIYTSEVVEPVRKHGIQVTHDYTEHPGAIPLPATLSLLLGKRIGELNSGVETRLYSPFPFPWRTAEGGLRDEFAREAWKRFQQAPEAAFSRFEELGGRPVLRYARADRMRAACVDCHNSHPDSPKRDWRLGDVRGVLEVVVPMHRVQAETRAGLLGTFALLAGVTLAGVGLLALVVGRLRRTSLELAARVQDLKEREKQVETANAQLRVARDEAVAASRAKSRFLAVMGHELRTPLNAIIGYSELLEEEAAELEEDKDRFLPDLRKIHRAGEGLREIVTEVLEFSSVDAGQADLQLQHLDAAGLAREVAATHRPLMDEAGHAFGVDCQEGVGQVRADPMKLRFCLSTLLANARKFTERGRITLGVSRETTEGKTLVQFRVEDSGIGMSAEEVRGLFQPFALADDSTTRKYGGIGLGLATTRSFCRLMGGDVTVTTVKGQGSTFTLRLPG